MKNEKLTLEKLQITKLNNPHLIIGGGVGETATDKDKKKSSIPCVIKKK